MIADRPLYFAILALTVVLAGLVSARHKTWLLAGTGLSFYLLVAPGAFLWIAGLAGVSYAMMVADSRRRRILLPVVVLVLAWASLKYTGLSAVAGTGSAASSTGLLNNVGVPLGLSYLTLELIGYQIDYSKGRAEGPGLAAFLAFVWFFPCRVAGPIRRYGEFQAAVLASRITTAALYAGAVRILFGLTKKYAADVLGLTVDELALYGQVSWSPLIAYPFQIYLDFSAYSDVAIGSARMLGVAVPENFDYPYLRSNIREFWSSWHMTLTSWLRDYVFMNAGSRLLRSSLRSRPLVAASVAYLITFLVCGLWHGIDRHFVVWGLYHGMLLAFYQIYRMYVPRRFVQSRVYTGFVVRAAGTLLTFAAVSFGWVFFKYDLATSWRIISFMIGRSA